MQWLHFEKGSPYTLLYKKSAADGLEIFSKVEMKAKPSRGRNLPTVNEKPRLKPAKFKDLMDQLPYIPPIYHGFYQSVSSSNDCERVEPNEGEESDETISLDQIFDSDVD